MTHRLTAPDKPGTLLKKPPSFERRKDLGRNPRERDEEHLAAVRLCMCLKCGKDPAGEAAHIRMASAAHGKKEAGIGAKPGDRWVVPLCHADHMELHDMGERAFFEAIGISPLSTAGLLYHVSPNVSAMRAACRVAMAFAGRPRVGQRREGRC